MCNISEQILGALREHFGFDEDACIFGVSWVVADPDYVVLPQINDDRLRLTGVFDFKDNVFDLSDPCLLEQLAYFFEDIRQQTKYGHTPMLRLSTTTHLKHEPGAGTAPVGQ